MEIAKRILAQRLIYPKLGYYKTFEQVFDDLNRDINTLEAFTSLWSEGAEVDLEFNAIIEIYNKLGKSKDNTISFFKLHFANPGIHLYSLEQYFDDVDRDISTLEAFASLWRDGAQLDLEFSSIIEIYNELGKSKDNTIRFFKIHFANPSIPLYYLESYLATCQNDVKVLAFVFDHMFLVTQDQPQDVKFEIVLNQFLKLKTIDKAKIVFDAFANLKRPVELPKFVDLSIKLTPSKAQELVEMTTDKLSLEKVLQIYNDRRLGNKSMKNTRATIEFSIKLSNESAKSEHSDASDVVVQEDRAAIVLSNA